MDWTTQLTQDLRFAVRNFAKRPAFTAIAALTLALGIGAATAVFSIVDAVLLRPLPYRSPHRLAAIWVTSTREGSLAKIFATHLDYAEFRRNSRTLESVSAATWASPQTGQVMTNPNGTREVLTIPATASFFDTLGVTAALGRTFRAEDETGGCSLVLTHAFWTANRAPIGSALTFSQKPCTVLGVMPPSFTFYPRQTQAWILIGPNFQKDQNKLPVGIFARLKPGVTLLQAETELRTLYRAIHPELETRDFQPIVRDLHGEFTFLAGRALRSTLLLVFSAVLFVLLIACLNVANLLLARLSERRREFAVRAALGSGQGRLIRQVLTEGLLLSVIGTSLGIALACAAVYLFRLNNPIELNVGGDVRVSPSVLAFSVALSLITTLLFSLLPAIRTSKVDLTQHLKPARRHFLAKTVIGIEMALSFLLLLGAGLLLTSALRMGVEDLGFQPHGILITRVRPPAPNPQLYRRLLDTISGAALASQVPPNIGGSHVLEIQGKTVEKGAEIHDIGADAISPGFFDLLQIPLRAGRQFGLQDTAASQPVTVVNEALVRKYFPAANPIGQQIRIGEKMPWLTIVGVVGNTKHTELMNEMKWVETPILYRPMTQETQDPRPSMHLVVSGAQANAPDLQRQISAVDPSIPIGEIETLNTRLGAILAYPRFRAFVLSFFAFAAVLLSAVGLHGVLAQLVSQRIPEFGVRKAIGAQTHHLLWLVLRQGGVPVLAGLATGAIATVAGHRLLSGFLYGLEPANSQAIAAATITLLIAALLAILRPAIHAARVDPLIALRSE